MELGGSNPDLTNMKIKATLVVLIALGMVSAFYFLFLAGGEPELHAGGDHGHSHGSGEQHHVHDGEELRLSRVLHDPAHQEPPEEPLVRLISQEKILSGEFLAPRFSKDGKYIIVSGNGYIGLWVANRDGSGLKQITDGEMAGWRPVSTRNGDLIYRTVERDTQGNLTFSIHRYGLENESQEVVYKSSPNEDVYPPYLSQDEQLLLILRDGKIHAVPLGDPENITPMEERDEGIAYSDGGQVWYQHLAQKERLGLSTDTEATGGEVASPGGNYVAYLSGNTDSARIVDLRTGSEIDIGEGSNLTWSEDERFLFYDVMDDDGHEILNAEIFVVPADGGTPQRLTFDETKAFHNPHVSGGFLAAEDARTGDIYVWELAESAPSQ